MKTQYKPSGYNAVSPYLIVDGAQRMIDLLNTVFSIKELRRYNLSDGKIMHAEVQLDDSVIMLADASPQYPANKLLLHVYVPDVEAVFQRALQAGCKPIEPPKQQEGDPDRRGMFEDFSGNAWAVSTQL